jgi:hypothetical protein
LNQREYCEAQGIPLKAFGNWRAKFKAEPQPLARKLLYRRGGLSHTLSHPLSHMTYLSSPLPGPVVPPAREGHRRRFSEADIVDKTCAAWTFFANPRITEEHHNRAGSVSASKVYAELLGNYLRN